LKQSLDFTVLKYDPRQLERRDTKELKKVKERIIVTGGAGFIGSNLCRELLRRKKDVEIIVLDNYFSGSKENLTDLIRDKRLRIIEGDIRELKILREVIKDADSVYHLAVACLGLSFENPEIVHEINDVGSFNLCTAAKSARKLRRLVYVSSSEVYGSAVYTPIDENHPLNPTTPYGASKAAGEMYVKAFHYTFNVPSIIVRPFNTYGPYQREDSYAGVVTKFFQRVSKGLPPIIFGNGAQTRDFTYISDTVNGIILASDCEELICDTVNIASGTETSINKLARSIIALFDKTENLEPIHVSPRPGDVRKHLASIKKAKKFLDYRPRVPLEEGLKLYKQWLMKKTK